MPVLWVPSHTTPVVQVRSPVALSAQHEGILTPSSSELQRRSQQTPQQSKATDHGVLDDDDDEQP
jgi:hypothetical protein